METNNLPPVYSSSSSSSSNKDNNSNILLIADDNKDDDAVVRVFISGTEASHEVCVSSIVCHGGSLPGQACNVKRNWIDCHERLMQQYFNPTPTYNDQQFRRRFCMSKRLFLCIHDDVLRFDNYFQQRANCTGKLGILSLLKVTAALRMMAYGCSADSLDENLEIGESTVLQCVDQLTNAVISIYGDKYLRYPTEEDLRQLLIASHQQGFPGMLGSIDCTHWEWKNCPVSLAGQYKGKDKKPTVVLEAIVDRELWFWHFNFGSPGSLNDINIINASPLFGNLFNDRAPNVEFTVNGRQYRTGYYLADGIYPELSVFAKTIAVPTTEAEQFYCRRQEGERKDVERAFGVLKARWRIIDLPCKFWYKDTMISVMQACVILHNMIVEDERQDNNDENFAYLFEAGEAGGTPIPVLKIARPNERLLTAATIDDLLGAFEAIQCRFTHNQLRSDLVQHLWANKGELSCLNV